MRGWSWHSPARDVLQARGQRRVPPMASCPQPGASCSSKRDAGGHRGPGRPNRQTPWCLTATPKVRWRDSAGGLPGPKDLGDRGAGQSPGTLLRLDWVGRFGRRRDQPAEVAVDLAVGHRSGEVEALAKLDAEGAEPVRLIGGLDSLRDHLEPQGTAELDDRLAEHVGIADAVAGRDERAVDLQLVDLEGVQIAQRRVARAEVVDREPQAQRPQLADALDG